MSEQKKVIIIGATSGIGRMIAEIYAARNYRVGITGRRLELLDEIRNEYPENIVIECFDVTGSENISKITSLISKLGGLDILIYSSGIGKASKTLDWELDKTIVDTNVGGFVEIANWGFNYFIKQGHGNLVTISSVAANRGNSWAPAYSASKAFQSNYFEALSMKAFRMKKKIQMTVVEPGFVDTKIARGNKLFWLVPANKAAKQIINAIDNNKRKLYVSKRWWIVAKLMRIIPFWIYKRLG